MPQHPHFLEIAFEEAQKAYKKNEVPIGAVLVKNNEIVARGHNLREETQNPLDHAENICIQKAANVLGSWRLLDCILYTTLEPCVMCAGSIIQARVPTVVFGAYDPKGGGESVCNLFSNTQLNHRVSLVYHEHQKSRDLLQLFFRQKRKK